MGFSGSSTLWARLVLLVGSTVATALFLAAAATGDTVICGPGASAGACEEPTGVAVDETAGLLFVADNGNSRIDVFDADDGSFVRAFGWDVVPAGQPGDTGAGLEVCTEVGICQAGSPGSGAGQFGSSLGKPLRIAVDNEPASPAFGDLYVFDGRNSRVQRFHPNGEFVLMFGGEVNKTGGEDACTKADLETGDECGAGVEGAAPGSFNQGARPAVGPGGVVYVADDIGGGDRRVQKFDQEGKPIAICSPLAPGAFGENLLGFALDVTGGFYLANGGSRPVEKYDASCAWLNIPFHSPSSIQALATDALDNPFVADNSGVGGETAVYVYDPSRTMRQVFYGDGTQEQFALSLAPYASANGDIFAAETTSAAGALGQVIHVAFPPPGPVVHPHLAQNVAPPALIGNAKATLNTRINPEGKATTYHFEYVDDATYQKDIEDSGPGHGFDSAKATPEKGLPEGTGPAFAPPLFRLSFASEQIGCTNPAGEAELPESPCLIPKTLYRFRAVATNADGGPRFGPEATFETRRPFEILDTWASAVGVDAAQLGAAVNPLSIPAKGHFEYVEEAIYQQDAKAAEEEGKTPEEAIEAGFSQAKSSAEVDFGAGQAAVIRTVQLHSLSADTTYRFRLFVVAFVVSEAGEARTFRTFPAPEGPNTTCPNQAFRTRASAPLPDCRAYEMVSPVDKEGGEIEVLSTEYGDGSKTEILQSAAAVPAEGRGLTFSSYRAFGDPASAPYSSQYLASRHPVDDPQEGWTSHGISPPREGASFGGLFPDTQYTAFSEDLGWALLRSDSEPRLAPGAIAGFANLYRRDNATDGYEAICPVEAEDLSRRVQGASADWETVVFRTSGKLTEDASSAKLPGSGAPIPQTYACKGGQLRVLSVLPPAQGGTASDNSSSAGTVSGLGSNYRSDNIHNAVSQDAERIYWTDLGDKIDGPGTIYLRERPFAEGGECAGPATPCTTPVSAAVGVPGAEKRAQFWTASPSGSVAVFGFTEGALQGNLYRFDAEAETTSPIAAGVSGVAGWSEDAERVYFVSTKELAPGAEAGEANLYLDDATGGGPKLVAVLPGGTKAFARCDVAETNPFERCARSSVDGSRLAFISRDPLTGYDNRDALNGEPDSEVFIYDASAKGGAGELTCVSCNPSGARPAGREVEFYGGHISPVAARIPGWAHSLHATRALSADGRRLFFESFDVLVPTDTNGVQDVYEWEEPGKGDCDEGDANYFPSNGGCISLISSGKSPRDSFFADASADGNDVFFKTAASLLPQDPGLIDLYDARVQGGFPTPPDPTPPCEGEACQSPPAPPEAPSLASSGFQGQGDPKGRGTKPRCRKGRRAAKKSVKRARCRGKQQRKGYRKGRSRR
jgi:DNA-binding beta-propeller fold protein YncE